MTTTPLAITEIEGLLRKGGANITPVEKQSVEKMTMSIEGGGEEEFMVTTTNNRPVTGTIKLYNTQSGEARDVDIGAIQAELRKTHHDSAHPAFFGKPQYTLDRTAVPVPFIGNLLCPLNPAHPDYLSMREIGAQPCTKTTLPFELAVEAHVRRKHTRTYENMEKRRERELEQEERDWRRSQMGLPPIVTKNPFAPIRSNAAPVEEVVEEREEAPLTVPAMSAIAQDPQRFVDEFEKVGLMDAAADIRRMFGIEGAAPETVGTASTDPAPTPRPAPAPVARLDHVCAECQQVITGLVSKNNISLKNTVRGHYSREHKGATLDVNSIVGTPHIE